MPVCMIAFPAMKASELGHAMWPQGWLQPPVPHGEGGHWHSLYVSLRDTRPSPALARPNRTRDDTEPELQTSVVATLCRASDGGSVVFGCLSVEPALHPRYLGLLSGDDPSAQRSKVWVHRLRVGRQDVAHGHCTSMVGNLRKADNPQVPFSKAVYMSEGYSCWYVPPIAA